MELNAIDLFLNLTLFPSLFQGQSFYIIETILRACTFILGLSSKVVPFSLLALHVCFFFFFWRGGGVSGVQFNGSLLFLHYLLNLGGGSYCPQFGK